MRRALRHVGDDLRNRRYLDAYAVALVSIILAVLSLVSDVVPNNLHWAVLFAAIGLLVVRISIPHRATSVDEVLGDRFAFEKLPLADRLRRANEVWIFAPSAVNILSAQNCEVLRKGPLAKSGGTVRVVVLDPHERFAVELATQQLDHSLDYPTQDLSASLEATMRLLKSMADWRISGSFDYRLLSYNPGFSLVAINPGERNGTIIVEMHGFHNESTSSRMHIEIDRASAQRWYDYWVDQYGHIWNAAKAHLATPEGHR